MTQVICRNHGNGSTHNQSKRLIQSSIIRIVPIKEYVDSQSVVTIEMDQHTINLKDWFNQQLFQKGKHHQAIK